MTDSQIHLYWDEMRVCDEVSFRFQMKGSTREKVATIAEHTLRCAPVRCGDFFSLIFIGARVELL